jgi:DNA-binding CsgD family transcriptional regulator
MMPWSSAGPLIGREAELRFLLDRVQAVRGGTAAACVIRGESGIGKTALLDAVEQECPDFLVTRAKAVPPDADLSFTVLADLVRPLSGYLDQLSEQNRATLDASLGHGPPVGSDIFGVAVAVLALVSTAAQHRPLLIRVDDAQWVDPSTLSCLRFVVRRLQVDGVLVLFTQRPTSGVASQALEGLDVLHLRRLDDVAAARLLDLHASGAFDRSSVLMRAAGHPLALLELARLASGGQTPEEGWQLSDAFVEGIRRLEDRARAAVEVLAILGEASVEDFDDLMRELGLSLEDVEVAENEGLVNIDGGRVGFRHPMIALAAYSTVMPARRRQLHLIVAGRLAGSTAFVDQERRAWHRIGGAVAADESLAADLESLAVRAAERASAPAAVHLLEKAAQFSTDPVRRAARLLAAAEHVQSAGLMDRADRLLDAVIATGPEPGARLAVEHLRCRYDMWRGQPVPARDRLLALAAAAAATDPVASAVMYGHAALTCAWLGDVATGREAVQRAEALLAGMNAPVLAVLAPAALLDLISGRHDSGRARLEVVRRHAGDVSPLTTEQLPLITALALFAVDEVAEALALMEDTVRSARSAAAVGLLPFQLSRLATIQFAAGQWHAAFASASEAITTAMDTGWITEAPAAFAVLAGVEAGRGHAAECRQLAKQALEGARQTDARMVAAQAHVALGLLEVGLGRPAEALRHLEQVAAFAEERGMVENPLIPWLPDAAECYLRTGDVQAAGRAADELGTLARTSGRPRLLVVHDRVVGLMSPPDEAEKLLRRSADRALAEGDQFQHARSLMCLGQLLRRRHQRAAARRPLAGALASFEHLGADGWAEQVRVELAASGLDTDQQPAKFAELSAQEMSVVQSAVEGLTNQQTAERLFLSVRTVEFHLSNAYRKLGVSRRAQLVRLFAAQMPVPVA